MSTVAYLKSPGASGVMGVIYYAIREEAAMSHCGRNEVVQNSLISPPASPFLCKQWRTWIFYVGYQKFLTPPSEKQLRRKFVPKKVPNCTKRTNKKNCHIFFYSDRGFSPPLFYATAPVPTRHDAIRS